MRCDARCRRAATNYLAHISSDYEGRPMTFAGFFCAGHSAEVRQKWQVIAECPASSDAGIRRVQTARAAVQAAQWEEKHGGVRLSS
jgi:hypothetical protein